MSTTYDWSPVFGQNGAISNYLQNMQYQKQLQAMMGKEDVPGIQGQQQTAQLPQMPMQPQIGGYGGGSMSVGDKPAASQLPPQIFPGNQVTNRVPGYQPTMSPVNAGGGSLDISTPNIAPQTTYSGPVGQALGDQQSSALMPFLQSLGPRGLPMLMQTTQNALQHKQDLADQQQQWQNEPVTLSPGQHRFVNGKDVGSVPEEVSTTLTPQQATAMNLPPLDNGSFYQRSPKGEISVVKTTDMVSPGRMKQEIQIAGAEATARQNAQNPALPPGAKVPGVIGDPIIHPEAPGYTTKPVPGAGGLTQAMIDKGAMQIAMGEGLPQGMGLGSTGPGGQRKTAMQNRAAEMDPSGNLIANKGQVKALTSSLTDITKTKNQIETAVNNSQATGQQLISAFQGKVNTGIPLKNILANAAAYQLDPANIASYRAGLQEVANTYSQVFARNGRVTDAVRNRANEIADGNISLDALQGVFKELNTQAGIVVGGYQNQINGIQGQFHNIIGGGSAAPAAAPGGGGPPPPSGNVIHYDAQGNRIK